MKVNFPVFQECAHPAFLTTIVLVLKILNRNNIFKICLNFLTYVYHICCILYNKCSIICNKYSIVYHISGIQFYKFFGFNIKHHGKPSKIVYILRNLLHLLSNWKVLRSDWELELEECEIAFNIAKSSIVNIYTDI